MNEQNTEILKKAFPNVFKENFYFECGDGWFELVGKIASFIDSRTKNCYATQVKEKFGTLRFYISYQYDDDGTPKLSSQDLTDIYGFIELSERQSGSICEDCGVHLDSVNREPQKNLGFWLVTLCINCAIPYKKRHTKTK